MTNDEPRLYRQQPIEVAAVQAPVRGEHEAEKDFEERLRKVVRWIYENDGEAEMSRTKVVLRTGYNNSATLEVPPGDFIIRDADGDWTALGEDYFNRRFKAV